jgi:putative transposase
MSHYRRADTAGATYFFTVVSYRRQRILCDEPLRTALRDSIKEVKSRYPFTIDAWVLLPDHIHCLWTLPPGDANFSLRWSMIKRKVSLACAARYKNPEWITSSKKKHRESTLWQRRYWEHQIRDQQDLSRHIDYIHYNPVKHGWCSSPNEWPYSTLHRYVEAGKYPENWAAQDVLIHDGEYGE